MSFVLPVSHQRTRKRKKKTLQDTVILTSITQLRRKVPPASQLTHSYTISLSISGRDLQLTIVLHTDSSSIKAMKSNSNHFSVAHTHPHRGKMKQNNRLLMLSATSRARRVLVSSATKTNHHRNPCVLCVVASSLMGFPLAYTVFRTDKKEFHRGRTSRYSDSVRNLFNVYDL